MKERFVTAAEPMHTIWEEQEWLDRDGKKHYGKRSRIFVPASVFDNKILLDNDPNYVLSLASMPEAEKRALLYGDWDSFSGQVFVEWRNDPDHYEDRRNTHVINPFVSRKTGASGAALTGGMQSLFRWDGTRLIMTAECT